MDIVAALEPTLGGINLEDIKAPECFYIEQKLRPAPIAGALAAVRSVREELAGGRP